MDFPKGTSYEGSLPFEDGTILSVNSHGLHPFPARMAPEIVMKAVGFVGDIFWDKSKPDGTPKKLLDISKIKSFGWQPKIGLEEGIKRTSSSPLA